jgi:hypothetical protein
MHKPYHYTKKPGRHQKTTADLPANWKSIIIEKSILGWSEVEIRAEIMKSNGKGAKNITMLWYALQRHQKEFLETVLLGKELCEAWWTAEGRKRIRSKYFRDHVWFLNMKNRFGHNWKDKQEIALQTSLYAENEGKTVDDLRREVVELAKQIIAADAGVAVPGKA